MTGRRVLIGTSDTETYKGYSDAATFTIDLAYGRTFALTVSSDADRTIAAPVVLGTACATESLGTVIRLMIVNSTGGAYTHALTFNPVFKKTAPTFPANGKRITGTFLFDGIGWWQIGGWSADL